MKRRDLVRHLESNGCAIRREGGSHTVYKNLTNEKDDFDSLAKKICDDLGVPRT